MDAAEGLELLRKSVVEDLAGESAVGVAYSGGLDSSLIAALAKESADVRCYTCVIKGSFDDRNAMDRAESESLKLTLIELTNHDIREIASAVASLLNTSNPVELAYTIPVYSVIKRCSERLVLAGNGADELFGGYAKYSSVGNPEQMMAADLEKMLGESESLKKAAESMGKMIRFPFAAKEMVDLSRSLPMTSKISSSERKIFLRDIARLLGLPSHNLPKKAAQYSSGILKEMERQAKADGKKLAEWTRGLAAIRRRSP